MRQKLTIMVHFRRVWIVLHGASSPQA